MAYKARIWDGSEWVPVSSDVTNLDNYVKKSGTTGDIDLTTVDSINVNGVSGIPTPNRNLLYNGAMQVAQRGTSVAAAPNGYNTVDRWEQAATTTTSVYTQSVENDAPTGSGFAKSCKMLVTTANASPVAAVQRTFRQKLEGQDCQRIAKGTASAQQLTLSFWVKSNVTGTFICEMYDSDNTRSVSLPYTISTSATWEKKVLTFPADTTGALDNNNAASLWCFFGLESGSNYTSGSLQTTWGALTNANRYVGQTNLAAATNNYWQITGVQLETGPVATEFEHEPYSVTLEKCRRYYQSYNYLNAFPVDTASSQTYIGTNVAYSPIMRATPNLTIIAPASGTTGAVEQWGGTVRTVANTTGSNSNLSYIILSSAITSTKTFGYHLRAQSEL